MSKAIFTVQNPLGLHARPASLFVQTSTSFPCEILLSKNGKQVNGKSIMGIMSLAIAKGDEIEIVTHGEKEEEALQELGKVIQMVHE